MLFSEKWGRAVSGRLQLPATTRLVRYAAAREYEDGNLAEAKRLYEKLSESGHDTASWLRLGVIAERQERFEAALRTYTEVADRDPSCGEAFYRAGCLLKRQDDPEGASVFFSRALSSGCGTGATRRTCSPACPRAPRSGSAWRFCSPDCRSTRTTPPGCASSFRLSFTWGSTDRPGAPWTPLADIDELSAQELFEQGGHRPP